MPHPVLHGPNIETSAKHCRGVGGTERLKVPRLLIKLRTLRDVLALIEHMPFAIPRRGWKQKSAILSFGVSREEIHEPLGNRNFVFLSTLRREAEVWLQGDPNSVEREIYVRPEQVHHPLLSETSK